MTNIVNHSKTGFVVPAVILLATVALFQFFVSYNAVWVGDDVQYGYIFTQECENPLDGENPQEISTFGDVLKSQYNHWFTYNGRTVAHIIVQTFCGLAGQTAFAVCNGLMWALLALLLFWLATGGRGGFRSLFTVTLLLLLTVTTSAMPSCQVGYVWMSCLVTLFLIFYFSERHFGAAGLTVLFVLSLLAGNAQEGYNLGIAVAIFVDFLRSPRRFTLKKWIMAAGFAAGLAFLAFSPGTMARAGEQHSNLLLTAVMMLTTLKVTMITIAVAIYRIARKQMTLREIIIRNLFWVVMFVTLLAVNLIVGTMSNRQLFGMEFASLIILMHLLKEGLFTKFRLAPLIVVVALGLTAEARNILKVRDAERRVEELYIASSDGRVYMDNWADGLSEFRYKYQPHIYESVDDYYGRTLRKRLSEKYPGKAPLEVYPAEIAGLDSMDVGNRVVSLPGRKGSYIVFVSKRNPAQFVASRKLFGIMPIVPKAEATELLLRETELWRAYLVRGAEPIVSYTSVDFAEN